MANFFFDLPDGTTLTTGNTGATGFTLGGGSLATAPADHPHAGGTGAKWAAVSGQQAQARFALTPDVYMRFRLYVWYNGTPDAFPERFFGGRTAGAGFFVALNTAARLVVFNTSGVVVFTATDPLPSAGLYRFEGYVDAASATVGAMQIAYFAGDSASPIQSAGITGANFNTGSWATFDIGRMSNAAVARDMYTDSVTVETSPTIYNSFIGPYIVAGATYATTFAALRSAGYTGTLSDMRRQNFLALLSLTEPQGTNNDLELRYWRSIGKTGSIMEMRKQP